MNIWILIVVFNGYSTNQSAMTAEFLDEKACEFVRAEFAKTHYRTSITWCVPKSSQTRRAG